MAVLYLVKTDTKLVIGRIIGSDDVGFRFHPNTSRHKSSRKSWLTQQECVPRWTKRYGALRIVTKQELDGITVPILQLALDDIAENGRVDFELNCGMVKIPKAAFLQLMTIRDDLAAKERRIQKPHFLAL